MTDTIDQNEIKVFVTTYDEHNNPRTFKRGDWFNIADYANREAFMKAAQEFVDTELGGRREVCLSDYQANFQAGELVGFNHIDAKAWDAIK